MRCECIIICKKIYHISFGKTTKNINPEFSKGKLFLKGNVSHRLLPDIDISGVYMYIYQCRVDLVFKSGQRDQPLG